MADDMLGGFFVKLGLKTDKGSFSQGKSAIQGLSGDVKKLSGVLKGAIFTGFIAQNAKAETESLKVSKAIGINTRTLDTWKIAAGKAGISAGALTSSMNSLEQKMQGLKMGRMDTNLANSLGMLGGIGYADFAAMGADDRIKTVFKAASAMQDQQQAAVLVGDVLGSAAQDYYRYLQLSGKSLDEELAASEKINFGSESQKRNALEFSYAINGIAETFKSIARLSGNKIAEQFTPALKDLQELLGNNAGAIANGIVTTIGIFGKGLAGAYQTIKKVNPYIKNLIDRFGGLDKVLIKVGIGLAGLKLAQLAGGLVPMLSGLLGIKGVLISAGFVAGLNALGKLDLNIDTKQIDDLKTHLEELWNGSENCRISLKKIAETTMSGLANEIIRELNFMIEASMDALNFIDMVKNEGWSGVKRYFTETYQSEKERIGNSSHPVLQFIGDYVLFGSGDKLVNAVDNHKNKKTENNSTEKIDDGIVSPNGRVTRVSPNDWVFAMKDLSNLAPGFLGGKGNASMSQNITVNQTFNLNGASRFDGKEVARYAERGTRNALQDLTNESAKRLLIMQGVV